MRTRRYLALAAATAAAFSLAAPSAPAQMTLVGDYPGSFPGARLGTTAPGTVIINTQPSATSVAPATVGASPILAPGSVGYAPAGQAGTVMIDTQPQPGFALTGQAPAYRPGGPVLYSSTAAYRQSAPAYRPAPAQPAPIHHAATQSYQPRLYSTVRPGGGNRR